MALNEYAQLLETLNGYVEEKRLIPEERFPEIENMLRDAEAREHLGASVYDAARADDFSQFENLHPVLRTYAASRYLSELPQELKDSLDEREEASLADLRETMENDPAQKKALEDQLKDRAMNPLFRLGCSLKSREDERYQYYDDVMVGHLMQETLRPMNRQQIETIRAVAGTEENANEMIAQNIEKQVQLARTLLMAHLGNVYLLNKGTNPENPNEDYSELKDRSVSAMMAHCSRTAFVLPSGSHIDEMVDSAIGPGMGEASGTKKRGGATHTTHNGATFTDFQEKKRFSPFNQRGMNLAIGGLGNKGISGVGAQERPLLNDGSCGHMYMRVDKGGKNQTTSLLIGFESDAPGVVNQQGHRHTLSAKQEYMSSFLGQRFDEFGEKYGGRSVDLTGYTPETLTQIMDTFSSHYRSLLVKGMSDPDMAGRAMLVNRMLAGDPIGAEARPLTILFNQAGIEREQACELVTSCLNAKLSAKCKMQGTEFSAVYANPLPPSEYADEIEPMQELKKPGKWVRFKAMLGFASAKEQIRAYQDCLAASRNPVAPEAQVEKQQPFDTTRAVAAAINNVYARRMVQLHELDGRQTPPPAMQRVSDVPTATRQMDGRENG